MKSLLIILFAVFVFSSFSQASDTNSPGDWQQITQTKDGITVFRKEIPGSEVLEFKGTGTIDAPLALIATVVFDCTRGTEWIEALKESRVLRWEGKSQFIEYDHVGTPFVMKDRDFVTRVTTHYDAAQHQMTIEYKSIDDPIAPKTSYIRGEMIHATFILTTTGVGKDQKTSISADIHCDPKGSVPKWIVNMFQKNWPVDTFRNLRKQLSKPDVKVDPRFADLT